MKFCQAHWNELREAIDERGLSHLVAKDGKAATDAAVRQIQGQERREDYDPLMATHWMIVNRALEHAGLDLMIGDRCPICFCKEILENHIKTCTDAGCFAEKNKAKVDSWIASASDATLKYAREKGYVEPEQ